MKRSLVAAALTFGVASGGCTVHHSRQAVGADLDRVAPASSRFVTEDDSGLLLLGLISLSEPDHYSVLLERARRKHKCARLSQGELDFSTDHWLIVAFPVARLTLLCEPPADDHNDRAGRED
jgi:hypothetical protein